MAGAARLSIRRFAAIPLATLSLVSALAIGPARAAQPSGGFAVTTNEFGVTVQCLTEPRWQILADRNQGGVISQFHLPDDSPNLISAERKADGTANAFQGMFNALFMGRRPGETNATDKTHAKNSLWRADHCQLSVLSNNGQEVVVEAKGSASSGSRLLGLAGERVVNYRQTYTCSSNRIVCDGEITWVYPHQTHLAQLTLMTFFAPDAIYHPVYALYGDHQRVELPIVGSDGGVLPAGGRFPMAFEVKLKNGHRLEFRSLEMPPILEKARTYVYEKPWQQDWAQVLGWTGEDINLDHPETQLAAGQPVHYRYEMVMSELPPSQTPPDVVITWPMRESIHPRGEALPFCACATDVQGNPIAASNFQWEMNSLWPPVRYAGAVCRHKVEGKRDFLSAGVTVTNAAGLKSIEYVLININAKSPEERQ